MNYKKYYEILNVEKKATQDDIKRAYRRLAKIYHPDSNPNDKEAEEKMREINEAYDVLSNGDKKKKYDVLTSNLNFWEGKDFFNFKNKKNKDVENSDKKSENIFSEFFNTFFSEDSVSIDDFFNTVRGTSRKERRKFVEKQYQAQGLRTINVEVEVEVTLQEAFKGVNKKVAVIQDDGTQKEYNINVPAGIRDGEKLRLMGLGHKNEKEDNFGDLFVEVIVIEDEKFKLDGDNIYTKIYLAPWEAVLGGNIQVQTISGSVEVRIPANIQVGTTIKMTGHGYKRGDTRGDMYGEVVIVIPSNLTQKERNLFECLQGISNFNPRLIS